MSAARTDLPAMLRRRDRPPCKHDLLMQCPLTARDWEEVFYAMLAFRSVCRSVSVRAHERANAQPGATGPSDD